MQIFLINHAESTKPADSPLSENGKAQARELSLKLSRKGIGLIFSSPQEKAKETAEILKKNLDREVEIIEGLQERAMKKNAAVEDYVSFRRRVLDAIEKITGSEENRIAVVTHSGPIGCFFREKLKSELKNVKDCEFFEIEYDKEFRLI